MFRRIIRWYHTRKWLKAVSKIMAKQLDCESRPWFKLIPPKEKSK